MIASSIKPPQHGPATKVLTSPIPRHDRAESRKPRAESREPRAESREPRAESREPRAESREPRAESREPRAESREPRAESREPRAESREPRAESREPRAESREPRAESREPRAESREPRADGVRHGSAEHARPRHARLPGPAGRRRAAGPGRARRGPDRDLERHLHPGRGWGFARLHQRLQRHCRSHPTTPSRTTPLTTPSGGSTRTALSLYFRSTPISRPPPPPSPSWSAAPPSSSPTAPQASAPGPGTPPASP